MKDRDIGQSDLETDVSDILKNFLDSKLVEGKEHFFTGKIEDVEDPEKLGRCRIRVYGVFEDEIPTTDLPWSKPDFNFIGSDKGSFIVPKVGTLVKVYFDNGDIYAPYYSTKAFNGKSAHRSDIPLSDYPNIMLFYETDEGESYFTNRSTLESMWTHGSSTTIKFDGKGNILIESNESSEGTVTIDMKGDIKLISQTGNISLEAPVGKILLGGDQATQTIPNVPVNTMNGSPTQLVGQAPGVPGAAYVRP